MVSFGIGLEECFNEENLEIIFTLRRGDRKMSDSKHKVVWCLNKTV